MAALVAEVRVAARAEVVAAAAVVVATMVEVLVSPLTLQRPSSTVLIHFVLKLIFPKYKKTKKFLTQKLLVREPFSFHQKV